MPHDGPGEHRISDSSAFGVVVSAGGLAPSLPPSIPDHELIRRIGTGSYGEVWLARSAVGTYRAAKIVYRRSFENAQPFEREFRGIQKFEPISRSHEGLVDLLQIGRNEPDGYFYYIMELADDANATVAATVAANVSPQITPLPTLKSAHPQTSTPASRVLTNTATYVPRTLRAEQRRQGRLPLDECVSIGLKLASALEHLHKSGLVHRDIKPSNIIFVNGVPKLADIGLVADATEAKSFVGTVGFIPPEGPGTVKADLYSLGKVLYEISTGLDRHDFPKLPPDLKDSPDRAGLSELNEVIVKACASDPKQRYQSAEEMHDELALLQRGHSVKHRRIRHERVVLAGKALAAAAVGMAVWLLVTRVNFSTLQRSNAPTSATLFVLPFRNEGTNGNDSGLADRATDAFIESLKQVKGATVAPRRSELGRRPEPEARAEAAKLFAVRYVLAGNVKTGDPNTLALTLHDLASDRMVWSQSFTGATEHLMPMETEAIHALAKTLNVAITPDAEQRIGQKLSNNLAAWKLVEQADKVSFLGRDSVSAAFQQYNEALQLDPDYAGALAGKAQLLRNMSGDLKPNEIWPDIKACGKRMLQIDPTSSQGQHFVWVTKFLFEWKWEEAERMFQERRARRLDWPVMVACYLRMVG